MDINSIDRSKLSDMQRRNLAAWQLKQYELRQQYGDRIRIVDPLEEVLSSTRPLTIPLSALDPGKQVSILMEEMREDPDGSVTLVHERGEMPMADGISDITQALEAKVDELRAIEEMRSMRKRKKTEFKVPEGYKLVKIEDEAPMEELKPVHESNQVSQDTIGVAISNESVKVSEDDAIKQLLDLLV